MKWKIYHTTITTITTIQQQKELNNKKKSITKKKTVKRIERFLKRNLLTKQINIKVAPKKKEKNIYNDHHSTH